MLIDVILDRKCGCSYTPEELKYEAFESSFANDVYKNVQKAVKSGDEAKVKKELIKYTKDNDYYSPKLEEYIKSVTWL